MIKAILGLSAATLLAVAPAKSCDAPANTDDPNQGGAQCVVVERANNSNGTAYLRVDCNGGGTDDMGPGGGVRSMMSDTEWPKCVPGASWPNCKTD